MSRLTKGTRLVICTFLLLFLMFCIGICGYQIGKKHHANENSIEASPSLSEQSSRQLSISAVRSASSSFFPAEEMGKKFNGKLSYYGVTDVTIDINGEAIALETALKNQQVTPEELFHLARTDAANGVCTEFYTSDLGLSKFFYSYPKFELMLTYDIFEAANGEQQLINEVAVCSWNYHKKAEQGLLQSEVTSLSSIYREDWGIEFKVMSVSPSQIKLLCTQSGGQQVGELNIISYTIQKVDDADTNLNSDSIEFSPITIPSNCKSEQTIIWPTKYNTLPSGTYQLLLIIQDNYNPTQIHPLIKKYTNKQEYIIKFDIP